jgi:hypothetical protein
MYKKIVKMTCNLFVCSLLCLFRRAGCMNLKGLVVFPRSFVVQGGSLGRTSFYNSFTLFSYRYIINIFWSVKSFWAKSLNPTIAVVDLCVQVDFWSIKNENWARGTEFETIFWQNLRWVRKFGPFTVTLDAQVSLVSLLVTYIFSIECIWSVG